VPLRTQPEAEDSSRTQGRGRENGIAKWPLVSYVVFCLWSPSSVFSVGSLVPFLFNSFLPAASVGFVHSSSLTVSPLECSAAIFPQQQSQP
jgi:hypothetical protein